MELHKHTALALLAGFSAILTTATRANAAMNGSEGFLDSLYINARVQAPRLRMATTHTFLAHPSLLQKWGLLASDAIATYNGLTNTLVLQPDMTMPDGDGNMKLASLREMRENTGVPARVSAAVVFHELSHAEYDLYVEENDQLYDTELLAVLRAEVPLIARANGLSIFKTYPLASEIFAYYREELITTILQDVAEIKLASGIEPDLDTCTQLHVRPTDLRDFSPNSEPYSKRVQLTVAWVSGTDVSLDIDKALNRRLNEALYKHALATLKFPQSRDEVMAMLRTDSRVRKAMVKCLKH